MVVGGVPSHGMTGSGDRDSVRCPTRSGTVVRLFSFQIKALRGGENCGNTVRKWV